MGHKFELYNIVTMFEIMFQLHYDFFFVQNMCELGKLNHQSSMDASLHVYLLLIVGELQESFKSS